MKIKDLYVYPIKALRPCAVSQAVLQSEGLQYDRRFMLLQVQPDGSHKSIQTADFPECTLFSQDIVFEGDQGTVVVRYHVPSPPLIPSVPAHSTELRVPLNPDHLLDDETHQVTLMGTAAPARRLSTEYDEWFSACLGYPVWLVYIGDSRRDILAHSPSSKSNAGSSWLSSITSYLGSYVGASASSQEADGLVFNECAPFLITSQASQFASFDL